MHRDLGVDLDNVTGKNSSEEKKKKKKKKKVKRQEKERRFRPLVRLMAAIGHSSFLVFGQ